MIPMEKCYQWIIRSSVDFRFGYSRQNDLWPFHNNIESYFTFKYNNKKLFQKNPNRMRILGSICHFCIQYFHYNLSIYNTWLSFFEHLNKSKCCSSVESKIKILKMCDDYTLYTDKQEQREIACLLLFCCADSI